MEVTEEGRVMEVIEVEEKALCPIVSTALLRVTCFREVQLINAWRPIEVTVLGMMMDWRLEH